MTSSDAIAAYQGFVLHSSAEGIPALGDGASELEIVLHGLPYLARRLTGADYAALTVMNEDGRITEMFTSGLPQEQADRIGSPPAGRGLLGFMNPGGEPVLVDKIAHHPASVGFPDGHPPMDAMLGVAVENDGRHTANLYLANRPGGRPFGEDDIEIVESVAKLAKTALENARLYRREGELRQQAVASRAWLEAVIAQASAGILVVDTATGRILVSSPEAERITGAGLTPGALPSEYHAGLRCFRPDGSQLRPDLLPIHVTRRSGQATGPVEIICERPDGRRIPTLVSAAPVPSDGPHGGAVIAVVQDVTNLKELDEVKSEFLSMITHDLRSPLATIKGLSASLAMALGDEPDLLMDAEAIDEVVDQTIDLVSNLLDMSRIEAGSYPLERELAHFVDITDDALVRALRSRPGQNRNVNKNVPPHLPPVFADPGQLGRVLDNLISNALKYSESDVAVTAEYLPNSDLIRTTVADSGIGIPDYQLGSVFDKFFRVTGGARAGRGAGLGLAICKAIVEAHGGDIGVDSTPGRGSTFWFTIPAHTDSASTSAMDHG